MTAPFAGCSHCPLSLRSVKSRAALYNRKRNNIIMLKLRHLFENFDLARFALNNWPHDEARLDETLDWFRISSNAIYPYFCNDKLCFLRLAPVEEKPESNVRGELEFIEYLCAEGYDAMRPIPSLSGETLLRLQTEWGEYYACSFERVPGEALDDIPLNEDIIRVYGAALGRLHALSSRYEPSCRRWAYTDALDWVADVLREYHAPECAAKEHEQVSALLAAMPKNEAVYGLVHYDFEPDNVFYDEATGRCSVIDFDDGMYHWFALDAEQALDELFDCCELPCEQVRDAFLGGYRNEFPFSTEQEQSLPLMRRFVDLFKYARLIRSLDDRFDDEPDWLTELRGKLTRVREGLEAAFAERS